MEPKKEPLTESYFYILLCLYRHANHGYGIMQEAGELSGGRVRIGSGTMYGATSNMIKKGWITQIRSDTPGEERRRLYSLTQAGRSALDAEIRRLQRMLDLAEGVSYGAQ